jgi:hypothetical protein
MRQFPVLLIGSCLFSGWLSAQQPGAVTGSGVPTATAKDWQLLQQWRFGAPAVAVPGDGIVISKDTAAWTLESGTVVPMEPVAGGRVTGFVFEGKGRFRMEIPDRFELAQLRRFTQQPAIERIDEDYGSAATRDSRGDALPKLHSKSACPRPTRSLAQVPPPGCRCACHRGSADAGRRLPPRRRRHCGVRLAGVRVGASSIAGADHPLQDPEAERVR